jgi:hypothetical protein
MAWWPAFCLTYDGALAACLVMLLRRGRLARPGMA